MLPVTSPAPSKFRPEFRTCFHCGVRLGRFFKHSKKSCLDCEGRMGRAIYSVRYRVLKAIKNGLLLPADTFDCADCGKPAVCYDHRDYSKPLEVAPVCKSCNTKRGPGIFGSAA